MFFGTLDYVAVAEIDSTLPTPPPGKYAWLGTRCWDRDLMTIISFLFISFF